MTFLVKEKWESAHIETTVPSVPWSGGLGSSLADPPPAAYGNIQ